MYFYIIPLLARNVKGLERLNKYLGQDEYSESRLAVMFSHFVLIISFQTCKQNILLYLASELSEMLFWYFLMNYREKMSWQIVKSVLNLVFILFYFLKSAYFNLPQLYLSLNCLTLYFY